MDLRSFLRLRVLFKRSYCFSNLPAFKLPNTKDSPVVTLENQHELLRDIMVPLWRMDYSEQILLKKNWSKQIVADIKAHKIKKCSTKIHNVIPSPSTESYRNKDEFSVRNGVDGNETVGFFIGHISSDKLVCVPPTYIIALKEKHIYLAQVYQDLIRSSPLRACYHLQDGGFWRSLFVRSNDKGEIMVIVIVHPLGASEEQLENAKDMIRDHFLKCDANVISIYLQACPHVRCTGDQAPYVHLHGQEHLYETMDDIELRISPDSFVQVNTDAASLLYKASAKLVGLNSQTTLLDLCCGIGSCSLILNREVRGCVGIDYVKNAIEDAKFNAEYNGVKNCHFYAGRLEKKLNSMLSEIDIATDIVPFVNPGRGGVNRSVISALRKSHNINRLVYVSCKPDGINPRKNFVDLCSYTFDKNPPFSLTDVQCIDMFPYTNHGELILVFKR